MDLWVDAEDTATFELTNKPDGPVEVDLSPTADDQWVTATVQEVTAGGESFTPPRFRATVLVCGPAVVTPRPGYTVIVADVLPRVRCDGRIRTDQWIRLRTR